MENLITKQKVAELLEVTPQTLNNWMRQGLTHYKHGKSVYFKQSDIEDFLRVK